MRVNIELYLDGVPVQATSPELRELADNIVETVKEETGFEVTARVGWKLPTALETTGTNEKGPDQ